MRLFISYRRADAQLVAGRMKTFLEGIPGVDEVFLDFDGIEYGEDFEERIQSALSKSSHCLILIGTDWAGAGGGADGRARVFDPEDFVRREAGLALASKTKVVPVLIDGAPMPRAADLPQDLHMLPKLNAFQLRSSHFNADMDDLLDVVFGRKKSAGSRWKRPRLTPVGIVLRTLGGLVAGATALVVAGVVNAQIDPGAPSLAHRVQKTLNLGELDDALGPLAIFAILILAVFALAPFAPRLLSRR